MGDIRQAAGNFLDWAGTALNLPEWNVSEKTAGGETQYTGTNPENRAQTQWLAQNQGAAYVDPRTGTSTQYGTPASGPGAFKSVVDQQQQQGGGGSGSGSGSPTAPEPEGVDNILKAAEEAYNSSMGLAGEVESNIRGSQAGVMDMINRNADENTTLAQNQYNRSDRQIATDTADTNTRFRNAIAAARQALSESMVGAGQRFGKASNIGKALGEYATVQFQKQAGQTRDTYERALTQLQYQKQQLEENFTATMKSINNYKQDAVFKAQQEFQSKLLEVAQMKDQAVQDKAARRIAALTSLRDSINAIKMQSYQFEQQLYAQTQAAAQQWQAQANSLSQYFGNSKEIGGANAQAMDSLMKGAVPLQYGQPTGTPTGNTNIFDQVRSALGFKKEEENPYGSVSTVIPTYNRNDDRLVA